ncbi:hypothetical protein [Vibrio spartinae]|uniref:Beta-lactamase superfamily domain protein n=1 Tax=Vibrio spartinae TaxID=1918945 RepID=A0ABX6QWN7_9VIBR|nr:hypothetical protein [Vibrio spartinae]QMV13537.1 hypothetical protein Vspart_00775 [Vibrio spartinae]
MQITQIRNATQIIDVDAVLLTHTHPDHWDETAPEHRPGRVRYCAVTAKAASQ